MGRLTNRIKEIAEHPMALESDVWAAKKLLGRVSSNTGRWDRMLLESQLNEILDDLDDRTFVCFMDEENIASDEESSKAFEPE